MISSLYGNRVSYKIGKLIGKGTFATVYLGKNLLSNETVAIKCVEKTSLSHYQREAHIYTLLDHPNIIRLIDVFETGLMMCYVLEFCEMDMFQALDEYGVFNTEVVGEIFNQILDGLIHCHSRSIFHRDLKPENILVSKDYSIRICDFGLSTFDSWSHDYGCGSLRYMSPECIPTNRLNYPGYSTEKSDVWSLGIILINMISGKNPWLTATETDPSYSIFLKDPNFLERIFEIKGDLLRLLKKILDPNPHTRISLLLLKQEFNTIKAYYDPIPYDLFDLINLNPEPELIDSLVDSNDSCEFSLDQTVPLIQRGSRHQRRVV